VVDYPEWEAILLGSDEYVVTKCGICGVSFVVPLIVHQEHYKHGGFSFCSNGHQWGWPRGAEKHQRYMLSKHKNVVPLSQKAGNA
jgi:hypothetical protein